MIPLSKENFGYLTPSARIYVFRECEGPVCKYLLLSDTNRLMTVQPTDGRPAIAQFSLKIFLNRERLKMSFSSPKEVRAELSHFLGVKLKFLFEADFVLGMLLLGDLHVMVFGTACSVKGRVFSHEVFRVGDVRHLVLSDAASRKDAEVRALLGYLRSDVRNYLFSRTYDLSRSLQMNLVAARDTSRLNFVINRRLLEALHELTYPELAFADNKLVSFWSQSCVYGFIDQFTTDIYHSLVEIVILARKDCQNLGTRYNRRGLNAAAFCANFVECEQIVWNKTLSVGDSVVCSSFVQVRGSVPMYWYQDIGMFDPKPEIKILDSPESLLGMRLHFRDLFGRYGPEVALLNLLFQKANYLNPKSEATLGEFYGKYAGRAIEGGLPSVSYSDIDLKNVLRANRENLFREIHAFYSSKCGRIGRFLLTRMYDERTASLFPIFSLQRGVIRSNCVDCLDRTNIAQAALSLLVVEKQIEDVLNYFLPDFEARNAPSEPRIFLNIQIQEAIFKIWEDLGDLLALDYTGTHAHSIESKDKAKLLVKRYWSNVFSDTAKQRHMNLLQNSAESLDNRFALSSSLAAPAAEPEALSPEELMRQLYPLAYQCDRVGSQFFDLRNKPFLKLAVPRLPETSWQGDGGQAAALGTPRHKSQAAEAKGLKEVKRFSNETEEPPQGRPIAVFEDELRRSVSQLEGLGSARDLSASHRRAHKASLEFGDSKLPRGRRMDDFDLNDLTGIEPIDPVRYLSAGDSAEVPRSRAAEQPKASQEMLRIKHLILESDDNFQLPKHTVSLADFDFRGTHWRKNDAKVHGATKMSNLADSLCIDLSLINRL